MKTREQIEIETRQQNPTSDGNTTGHPKYEALIEKWTDESYRLETLVIPKSWPNSHEFINELTDEERNSLATNPNVAGLALLLSSWQSNVVSDDPRIEAGLAALIAVGILTQARVDEIVSG